MSEIPICYRCNKQLFSVDLTNKDEKTWCNCSNIGVPDGWSGYVEKRSNYKGRRR